MTLLSWQLSFWLGLGLVVAGLLAANRYMKPIFNRIVLCVLPLFLGVVAVGHAWYLYQNGRGGFKLGVDLVGGTILVYEIDPTKEKPQNYKPEQLAASLKRRIDPTDLYNVTIRP